MILYFFRTYCFICIIHILGQLTAFQIKCPDIAQWNLYGKGLCSSIYPSYVCLLDENNHKMMEMCELQPNFITPGYRFVLRGNYDGKPCDYNKFQPFKFWTNGSSDCIFLKSKCDDEGQIYLSNGSTTTDVTCGCDSSKGYAFVHKPRQTDYCRPSNEDCSCYLQRFDKYTVTLQDYKCNYEKTYGINYLLSVHENGTINVEVENLKENRIGLSNSHLARWIILILLIILVVGIIAVLISSHVDTIQKPGDSIETSKNQLTAAEKNTIHHDLLESLLKRNIVTVVSPDSLVLDNVIDVISKNHGFNRVPCSFNIDKIELCLENPTKQLICIHITKNGTIDNKIIGHWKKFLSSLYNHPDVKLLFTSELPVFQSQFFQEIDFLQETIFDFKLHQVKPESAVKGKFNAHLFLTDEELDSVEQYHHGNAEETFQVLCKRYAQKQLVGKAAPAKIFFKNLRKSIEEDICDEMGKDDKCVFVALLLLVINGNCVLNEMVSSGKLTKQLENICKILQIVKPISPSDLTKCYEFLAKSYLEKTENSYRIANEEIRVIMLSVFGELILPVVINPPRKENGVITDR